MQSAAQHQLSKRGSGSGRVAVVLVTYNRKKLLMECLSAVLAQSRGVDKVFLIDNASTDQTYETLVAHEFLKSDIVEYIRNEKNTGGAGGFYQGMKLAVAEGYDWLWVIDDDVEPERDALEKALEYGAVFDCIQMNRLAPNGEEFKWEQIYSPQLNVINFKDTLQYANFAEVNVFCFEGLVIKRKVIEKVGLPPASFFIRWDDLLYGYLCSRVSNIALVKNSILKRKLESPSGFASNFSVFYELRNRVWTRKVVFAVEKFGFYYKFAANLFEFLMLTKLVLENPRVFTGAIKGYLTGIFTRPVEFDDLVNGYKGL